MTATQVDPEVAAWKSARWDEILVHGRPRRFSVADELYAKLRADAEQNTDLLGYDLVIYRNGLVFNRVPVEIAGPTGDES